MESGLSGHILYLPRWYPSQADPMPGLFVRKHALAAVSAGYKVTVVFIVPGLREKSHELFRTDVNDQDGLTEIIVSYRSAEGLPGMARQLIAWNLGVKKACSLRGRPLLIHAHILTRTALIAWWYARKWNIPFLITEHWSRYFSENFQFSGFLRKRLTRFAVKRAAALTAVSRRLAGSMQAAGIQREPEILPNVVDTALFTMAAKSAEKPLIISITCFEEKSKNLKMLLDAFQMVRTAKPESELVLVGEGADQEMIRTYVRSKNFPANSVRFTGLLENEALAGLLRQASCLALPSNYETFGIVAYEAMACGVPVVATDVADLADFVKPDSGSITPVGNTDAFARALLDALANPRRFNREKMRGRVAERYGPEAVSQRMDEIYKAVLNRNK